MIRPTKGQSLAAYSVAYSLISRASLFLINILAAYFLIEADYGVFAFISLTIVTVATLGGGGLGQACSVHFARLKSGDLSAADGLLTWSMLVGLIAITIFTPLLAYPFLVNGQIDGASAWTLAAALGALLMVWQRIVEGALFGLQAQRALFFIAVAVLAISLLITAWLGSVYALIGAVGALILFRLIFMLSTILTHLRLRPHMLSPAAAKAHAGFALHTIWKTAVPISIAAGLAMPVFNILFGSIVATGGGAALAPLAFAYQFFVVLTFIPNAVSNFLISAANQPDANIERVFWRFSPLFLLLGLAGGAAMLAVPTIAQYVNNDLRVPLAMVAAMGLAIVLYSVAILLNSYWIATERAFMAPLLQAIYAGILLLLGLALLETRGADGVAIALPVAMAGHLVISLIALLYQRRKLAP